MTNYQKYIKKLNNAYDLLMEYIENDDEYDVYLFAELIDFFQKQQMFEDRNSLQEFLALINKVSKYHQRNSTFISKMEKIISFLEEKIKQNFSNTEIFEQFMNNKRILLFLIRKEIVQIDDIIIGIIDSKSPGYSTDFYLYFYNVIKQKISKEQKESIKTQLLSIDENIFEDFDKKCQNGENDSYICTLIRQDSVQEFIKYVNEKNVPLTSTIKFSIFETNRFLFDKNPNLIEYAAFYGSIQIFQYLRLNNVEMTPSLWFYSIHSKNAELIHVLEENHVETLESNYEECFIESIKCHHNDIAKYFQENFLKKRHTIKLQKMIIKYYNYRFFQFIFDERFPFYFLYRFKHNEIINLYMKMKKKEIENDIKSKKKNSLLYNAVNENDHEIVYYILSKENEINPFCFLNNGVKRFCIPPTITTIGRLSFSSCKLLVSIVIPSSVKRINTKAFVNCIKLSDVSIPSSIEIIDEYAFFYCASLIKIKIPFSVKFVGKYAFNYCESLKFVEFPSSMNVLKSGLFDHCFQLKQFNIPSSINKIEELCFSNCFSLTQIIIPDSVTEIGDGAFSFCKKLQNITIPSSVKSIGSCAFENCTSLIEIVIPSSITIINKKTFYYCSNLKKITIPSSVTMIKENAFDFCTSLCEITIPSSVTLIESMTFNNCFSLKQLLIPSSVKSIGEKAFYDCKSLKKITIPSSVVSIGKLAFCNCLNLTDVVFAVPSSITSIGEYSFSMCKKLHNFSIPSSVNSIGEYAFHECSSIEKIKIPNSVSSINTSTFCKCSSLKKISIPSSVKSINNYSFSGCYSLAKIKVAAPASISSEAIPNNIKVRKYVSCNIF